MLYRILFYCIQTYNYWHERIGENIIENFTYFLLTNAQNIKSFEQYSYFESNELRNTIYLKVTDNK